jgi:hypothetical protein
MDSFDTFRAMADCDDGKAVNASTMTDAFVQRAGGEPGVVLASTQQPASVSTGKPKGG